jgi:hypothetical protein
VAVWKRIFFWQLVALNEVRGSLKVTDSRWGHHDKSLSICWGFFRSYASSEKRTRQASLRAEFEDKCSKEESTFASKVFSSDKRWRNSFAVILAGLTKKDFLVHSRVKSEFTSLKKGSF